VQVQKGGDENVSSRNLLSMSIWSIRKRTRNFKNKYKILSNDVAFNISITDKNISCFLIYKILVFSVTRFCCCCCCCFFVFVIFDEAWIKRNPTNLLSKTYSTGVFFTFNTEIEHTYCKQIGHYVFTQFIPPIENWLVTQKPFPPFGIALDILPNNLSLQRPLVNRRICADDKEPFLWH
jgi:hypothetical protein